MLHIFKNAKSFLIEREEFLKLSTVFQEAAAVDRHVQVFIQEGDYRAAGFFEGIPERAYHGVGHEGREGRGHEERLKISLLFLVDEMGIRKQTLGHVVPIAGLKRSHDDTRSLARNTAGADSTQNQPSRR